MATLDNRAANLQVAGKSIDPTTGNRVLLGGTTEIARYEQQRNTFYTRRFELDITGVAAGVDKIFKEDTGVVGIPIAPQSTTLVSFKVVAYNVTDNTSAIYTGNVAAARGTGNASVITLPAGIPAGTLAPAAAPAVGAIGVAVNGTDNRIELFVDGLASKRIIATATVEVQSVAQI